MTTPISPISLLDMQNEFGGDGSISFNEYYAGGAFVPNPQNSNYGSIPTGGAIGMDVMRNQTKILPLPAPYPLIRFNVVVDRITVYRIDMYTGAISVVSSTSSQSHSNHPILGVTNSTELAKPTATASIVVEAQNRGTYQYYVSHNPTAAEPYVDITINDDPPSASWVATIRVDIQLGNGAVRPFVSTAPYYFEQSLSLSSGNNFSLKFVAYNLTPGATYQFNCAPLGSLAAAADGNTRAAFINYGGVGYQMQDQYISFDTVYNGNVIIHLYDGPFNGPQQQGGSH